MKRLTGLVLSVTAALCVTGCPGEYGDDQLHVKDGAIYRESHDATLRAVTLADLGQPGFERVATLERINQAAAAGASAVCFDLYGLGAEGEEVDQAVAAYTELVGLLTHQSVMGVCRVFGRHPGADDAWRKEKLTQFAKRIPERYEVIYWLEGEDPAELAAALDEAAPQLLAAASEGGDVTTLPLGQDARGPGPFLHIDALPTSQDAHFVLTGGEDDFAKLETYAAMRGEKLPWEHFGL
jgi:hypothetical protein